MILRWFILLLPLLQSIWCGKSKGSEVQEIKDIKHWKKELRTKKNVLTLFTKDTRKSGEVRQVMDSVSITMRGLATLIWVDCDDSAAKLCKKLKINPKPYILNHYNNGELNKAYDRKLTETSMELFLRDPLGDIPWSEDEKSEDVQHLDYPSFKRLLRKTDLPILAMFYAPWCGHCKRMKPEFNQAATTVKGRAILAGIDVEGNRGGGAATDYNVTSYPTILYFEKGVFRMKFTGERTATGIVSWLEDPKAEVVTAGADETEKSWAEEDTSPVGHLTLESFSSFMKEHPSVLVMFYAPWCGHCKAMKPEFSAAATLLEEQGIEGKLAAVDVTKNRPLGDQFSVKGFPTVIYFKNGNKTFEHPGLRKQGDIVSFMKDPKEPPAPAPEEIPWSEQESAVVHLTGADGFDKTVKRKKHSLVMFYAPWCGHCKKAKPEFTAAAESLSDNNKVLLGAIDCTQASNKDVCTRYGVKGYPTILYFNYGGNAHKYSGSRISAGFITAMSREDPASRDMNALEGLASLDTVPSWTGETVVVIPPNSVDTWIEDNAPAFVLYYRSGCVTCAIIQTQFTAVSTKLASPHLTFGALDCSSTKTTSQFCSESPEPTLVLHRSGGEHEKYYHDMTSRDMYNFVVARHDEL